MIEVEDLPDTQPYFLIAPPVTKLPETATIVSFFLDYKYISNVTNAHNFWSHCAYFVLFTVIFVIVYL